jgi:signal peptidase II
VENRGIAFSMLSGKGLGLVLFTAALIAGLVAWLVAHPDAPTLLRTGLWLIAGGGLGNLYDRLAMGSVSDFIELAFMRFAVFNVADVCICVGAGLVLLGSITGDGKDGK